MGPNKQKNHSLSLSNNANPPQIKHKAPIPLKVNPAGFCKIPKNVSANHFTSDMESGGNGIKSFCQYARCRPRLYEISDVKIRIYTQKLTSQNKELNPSQLALCQSLLSAENTNRLVPTPARTKAEGNENQIEIAPAAP